MVCLCPNDFFGDFDKILQFDLTFCIKDLTIEAAL